MTIAAPITRAALALDGRTWHLSLDEADRPNLRQSLLERGFDGTTWKGISKPTGRQRKAFTGLFYRSPYGVFQLIARFDAGNGPWPDD